MLRHLLTSLTAIFTFLGVYAQSLPNFFKKVDIEEIALPRNSETVAMPRKYIAYSLDIESMSGYLQNAPMEGSAEAMAGKKTLQLPMPDGGFEAFKVWETFVMHPDLAARYPMIRTFAGQSIADKSHTVRLGYGLDGFHASVSSEDGGALVMPFASNQTEYYLCYKLNDLSEPVLDVPRCGTDESAAHGDPIAGFGREEHEEVNLRGGGEGSIATRRTYRFALACTAEFAQANGGTVPSVLSRMVTATNLLTAVTERDAGLRFELIPNNDLLVFLTPSTDPYTNPTQGAGLLAQNELAVNNIIGAQSYDIGHIFTVTCSDVGGIASLSSACTSAKARGVTCHYTNLDYIVNHVMTHEVGHQLSGTHSFNNCQGQMDNNITTSTAWEPGSGSTFLSYFDVCQPSTNLPDPYTMHYHGGTVDQFWEFLHFGSGAQCGNLFESANRSPSVSLPYTDGFFIPIRTPFELKANATDEDGDALTYSWEQMDLGPISILGTPLLDAPAFRVYNPSQNPMRVFPRLPVILNNGAENVEVLPTISRNFNFRCTVRDNNVAEGAGGITWADVSFKATAEAGPFLVQYPNTSDDDLVAGTEVTITWDVANTDKQKVNCKAVNIKLSTDGGQNFNRSLAVGTPNDGSETVFIPDVTSDNARIRVEAADNIFFDLSNQNFSIAPATTPTYSILVAPQLQQICVPNSASVEIQTESVLGFDAPVSFDVVSGLPNGALVSFSNNPATPGQSTMLTFNMDDVTADGNFEISLRAVAGADTVYRLLFFNIVYNDFSAMEALTPSNGQSGLGLQPIFTWTDLPQADLFDFELSTSPSFEDSTIVDSGFGLTEASFTAGIPLEESTIYYWRVRPYNECGAGPYMTSKTFQTFTVQCTPFSAIDVPKPISSVGTPTINSILNILQNGTISDVNVTQIKGEHDVLNDLRISLVSPVGTRVKLFENICGNVSTFNFGLNDESPFAIDCPPLNGYSYKPQESLAAFIGENTVGEWTLQVEVIDPDGQGGSIEKWGIEFCASISPNSPFLVNNDTIYVKPLDTRIIYNFELAADDVDNQGDEIVFTIVDETDFGYISRNGVQLGVGDRFNMKDIHLQRITYTNTDGNATYDFFTFIVEDGTGGWLGTPKMNIVIDENAVTGTKDKKVGNTVLLVPNPASTLLNINFVTPVTGNGKADFFDVYGRLVTSRSISQDTRSLQVGLEGFANGIYFVSISTPEGVVGKKFVVEKQ
jgi:subtilisin-like proprotein convertase family protein